MIFMPLLHVAFLLQFLLQIHYAMGKPEGSGTGMGASPWNFIWKNTAGTIIRQTNGVVSDQIINLNAGTYTLVTVDPTGCSSSTLFVISAPQVLSASAVVNDTKCAITNGIILSASGGSAPYTYSKDNGANYQGSATFSNLAAGTYFLMVKDAHGCVWSGSVIVGPSTLPVISNIIGQDILCPNGMDGSINIAASGGIAPYTYSIDNGSTFQNMPLFDSLPAQHIPSLFPMLMVA